MPTIATFSYFNETNERAVKNHCLYIMKIKRNILFCLLILILFSACSTKKQAGNYLVYKPQSKELYNEIVRMDSIWEDAYNNCKINVQDQLISDSIEFFHDQGGLVTSKTRLMNSYKSNICGKVTRELLKGSIEVYPIKDYGAVEMGYHRFHSIYDTSPNSAYARFVHVWKKENGSWKITRVISLHN
jgi:ketosteroid isomerase-like protein